VLVAICAAAHSFRFFCRILRCRAERKPTLLTTLDLSVLFLALPWPSPVRHDPHRPVLLLRPRPARPDHLGALTRRGYRCALRLNNRALPVNAIPTGTPSGRRRGARRPAGARCPSPSRVRTRPGRHGNMLIHLQIENPQPLAGTAASEGSDPLHFDGWLELLTVISELVEHRRE
jgi:hypothetical protein